MSERRRKGRVEKHRINTLHESLKPRNFTSVLQQHFTSRRLLLRYPFIRSTNFNEWTLEVVLPYVYSYVGTYTGTFL